mgnify:CR=1 FL=1
MTEKPAAKFTARQPKPRAAAVDPLAETPKEPAQEQAQEQAGQAEKKAAGKPKEVGGPSGPEPTRYGDWERKGICVDF